MTAQITTAIAGIYVLALSVAPTAAQTGRSPASVKTDKGAFAVPGKAYADGRDTEASPPLTVMKINVWDTTHRTKRACAIAHGEVVDLVASARVESEGRFYFQIRTKACEGWVPEAFVSLKRHAPVGSRQ
jgi:hypothetical protein